MGMGTTWVWEGVWRVCGRGRSVGVYVRVSVGTCGWYRYMGVWECVWECMCGRGRSVSVGEVCVDVEGVWVWACVCTYLVHGYEGVCVRVRVCAYHMGTRVCVHVWTYVCTGVGARGHSDGTSCGVVWGV